MKHIDKTAPEAQDKPETEEKTKHPVPTESSKIKRPGISSETLRAAGIRHVSADEAEDLCGKSEPGLWIPFLSLEGSPIIDSKIPYGRLRLDSPPPDGGKYHQQKGTGVHAYLPTGLSKFPIGQDIVLVEGEFKALSLVEAGIPAIGISGFYGWGYKHPELGPQIAQEILLAIYSLAPNQILFVGDSDTALNYQFADAASKLAEQIRHPVKLPRIPLSGPGKGVDDCREKLKDEFLTWWTSRVKSAVKANRKSSSTLARMLCEAELETLEQLDAEQESEALSRTIKLLTCMKSPADRDRLLKKLAKTFNTSVTALRESVKDSQFEMADKAREATKDPREADPDWGPILTKRYEDKNGNLVDGDPSQRFFGKLYTSENEILFESDEGKFYQYSSKTGVWSHLTREYLQQRISDRMIIAANQIPGHEFLDTKTNVEFLNSTTKQIQGIVEKQTVFNQKKELIHCASYMVGFKGEEILHYRFDSEFYSRNRLCIDPDFKSPPTRFLKELVYPAMCEEDAILLQKFCGLFILQDNPAQQFLILTGLPGGGKTQLVRIICQLVHEFNTGLLRTKHLGERFELGRLMGKSLLIGSDVDGDFLEQSGASTLKAMVGGDPLDVELKHGNGSFSMSGRFNVLITCNEQLRVRIKGDSGAWHRRLAIIRYEGSVPAKVIANFSDVLFKEEGPQILAWAIEGAKMLLQDLDQHGKIRRTKRQLSVVTDLLHESQSLEHFVKYAIEPAKGIADLSKNEALEAYADYCLKNGWKPFPLSRQQKEIPELIIRHYHASLSNSLSRNEKATQGWRNIRLKSEGGATV